MRVEIVSDMVCPWCYLGKRRLEAALARRPGMPVEVHWLPFELNPDMPPGGLPRDEYLGPRLGGLAALRQGEARLTALAAREGVTYRFDLIRTSPNTRAAHALARMAAEAGLQDRVLDALFRAYFESGEDIGDAATLARIAGEAGLDPGVVGTRLGSREHWPAIESIEREVRAAGITSVPFFILDRRLSLSGAQEPGVFEAAFDRVAAAAGAGP